MKARRASRLLFLCCLGYLVILGILAAAAPFVSTADPTRQDLEGRFAPPGTSGHPLGTDGFGRDVLSRIIYGSRSALAVGLISVTIALAIGLLAGLTAGLSGGFLDQTVMLIMDSLLSFPTILLAITVVSILGYGLPQVMIAIGVIYSPVFTRLVRAETKAIKAEGYIESSRALGTPLVEMVAVHFLPNMAGKVIVQCAVTFALSVVIESSLSFLGLGTQPPDPSWGLMLKDARNYVVQAPWLAVFPGLAIALTVLAFNIMGDTASELLNPHYQA